MLHVHEVHSVEGKLKVLAIYKYSSKNFVPYMIYGNELINGNEMTIPLCSILDTKR